MPPKRSSSRSSKAAKGADTASIATTLPPPSVQPTQSRTHSEVSSKRSSRTKKNYYERRYGALGKAPFVKHKFKKRRWPKVTKVHIPTRKWVPPPPPKKPPKPVIEIPTPPTRPWIPPDKRRKPQKEPLPKFDPFENLNRGLPYESSLKKVWHSFQQVGHGKMILQGSTACNSRRYGTNDRGNQTSAIALVTRCILHTKTPAQLKRNDVDTMIVQGDRLYKNALVAMKCYKGDQSLTLEQLMKSFYVNDIHFTVKMNQVETGVVAKHPDDDQTNEADLKQIMDKYIGKEYMFVLTVDNKSFLVWGGPPESDSNVKTVCYIMDPNMLDHNGNPNSLYGYGAILRYAGMKAFVSDFITNYGNLDGNDPKNVPGVALTEIEIVTADPVERFPTWYMDADLVYKKKAGKDAALLNALADDRMKPILSETSVATSKSRKRTAEFFDKPKPPSVELPVELVDDKFKQITVQEIVNQRGSDFFLYAPKPDDRAFGRDELLAAIDEKILHSMVDVEEANFRTQYKPIDAEMAIISSTRHAGSRRYQDMKTYNNIAVCVAGLAKLRQQKARGWNEDMLDEAMDVGAKLYQDSLTERGGEVRRLILGELKDEITMKDGTEFNIKTERAQVLGRLITMTTQTLDLSRGLQRFFKSHDYGILQVPGECEVAVWQEGDKFYMFDPMPADYHGNRVGIREGGKGYILKFSRLGRMAEQFIENLPQDKRRKPFTITEVKISKKKQIPEPTFNQFKAIAPTRWIVSGSFHEGDNRFPEEHRGKQGSAVAVAALALTHVHQPAEWTPENVDQALIRGDILYEQTLTKIEGGDQKEDKGAMGDDGGGEADKEKGLLGAADINTEFQLNEYDCIETEVLDSMYAGTLNVADNPGHCSVTQALSDCFREFSHAVFTARGESFAIFRDEGKYYFFDPHSCDENGNRSENPRGSACLIRLDGGPSDFAAVLESNLLPGTDDTFNISPVLVTATKINSAIGAPEPKPQGTGYEWVKTGAAAVLMGARGENSAAGKAVNKAKVNDMSGRTLALPAAAAFVAASSFIPPPHMHEDHMHNFLNSAADYYLEHLKKGGSEEMEVENLDGEFTLGTNKFAVELAEPIETVLRIPDEVKGEGGGEEEEEGELEEIPEPENPIKDMRDAIGLLIRPNTAAILDGPYHRIGLWKSGGGAIVAFDPAPTMPKQGLTDTRIKKGDEIRLSMEVVMPGEDIDEEAEAAGEGGPPPEVEDSVPPNAAPCIGLYASAAQFIDALVFQGGLIGVRSLVKYKLYPCTVIKDPPKRRGDEGAGDGAEEEDLKELPETCVPKHFVRIDKYEAKLRARMAQDDIYFLDTNRDNQDASNAILILAAKDIESYDHWKPELLDAFLKYGDRLHTASLPTASVKPRILPRDVLREFRVTNFEVRSTLEEDLVRGDINAADDTNGVLSLKKGIEKFFETYQHGIINAKGRTVAMFKGPSGCYALWTAGGGGRPACVTMFSNLCHMAEAAKEELERDAEPGNNRFYISNVKTEWSFRPPRPKPPVGVVPDERYENKVLTAYVEIGKGKTMLKGTYAPDVVGRPSHNALMQTACGAIVSVCMAHIRKPDLWTKHTVDEVVSAAEQLFYASLADIGYEFRPDEDILMPLQVLNRFVLGVNYIKYDLQPVCTGKLDHGEPHEKNLRQCIEKLCRQAKVGQFVGGVLWAGAKLGAAGVWCWNGTCLFRPERQTVYSYTTTDLACYDYTRDVPLQERSLHEIEVYKISVHIYPLKTHSIAEQSVVRTVMPATSKVNTKGELRRVADDQRKRPPQEIFYAAETVMQGNQDLKGRRNEFGWLVLEDGSQYLSGDVSQSSPRYDQDSRGYQSLANCLMAVVMANMCDVCRWTRSTMTHILDSGDQLYKDSYLHYGNTKTCYLNMGELLRIVRDSKGNKRRIDIMQARQSGVLKPRHFKNSLKEFLREEPRGVILISQGDVVEALGIFCSPKGIYLFDPADRDSRGNPVKPEHEGYGKACLSFYPNVDLLADKILSNLPYEDDSEPPPEDEAAQTDLEPGAEPPKPPADASKTSPESPKGTDTSPPVESVTKSERKLPAHTSSDDMDRLMFSLHGVDVIKMGG